MKRPGFGLIETLITLGLSVFFVTGTGQLLVQSLRLQQKSESDLSTARLASTSIERLRALPFENEALRAGDYEDSVTDVTSGRWFHRRWRVEDITPEVKQVDMEVSSDNSRFRSLHLLLRVSRSLGF
jgi:Tfp pilus assembly protein PilV